MSQESDHERIRRLIQERMEQGERPKEERLPPVNLDAAIHGDLRLLAFALFRQAFMEAMVEQRERDAGIVPGDPNTPVSWDGLEALLGKEQVDRFRRGRTSKESGDWEVCWLEPGGTLNSKKVVGYARARLEASNLKYKLRDKPGVRVWITREF